MVSENDTPVKSRTKTGAERPTTFKKGNRANPSGRPRGSKNKATLEAKAFATAIVDNPAYQAQLRSRMLEGRAGPMEAVLWHYGKGKPKDIVEVTVSHDQLSALSPEQRADLERHAAAIVAMLEGKG